MNFIYYIYLIFGLGWGINNLIPNFSNIVYSVI